MTNFNPDDKLTEEEKQQAAIASRQLFDPSALDAAIEKQRDAIKNSEEMKSEILSKSTDSEARRSILAEIDKAITSAKGHLQKLESLQQERAKNLQEFSDTLK